MGLFHHHQHHEDAYNTMWDGGFNPQEHQPRVHELLAGAAAFAAMRQFEQKRAAEGFQDHAMARELLAAFSAAEVDKLVETKGLDMIDAGRAKADAREHAHQMYNTYYAGQQE